MRHVDGAGALGYSISGVCILYTIRPGEGAMGRGIILPAVLALAISLLFCGCGSGGAGSAGTAGPGGGSAPTTGTISGKVIDSGNAALLPYVEVTATDNATGGEPLARTMTDGIGRYSLTAPIGGCYVKFSKADYTPSAGIFVDVVAGMTVTLNAEIAEAATGGWNVLDPADVDRLKATKICPGCRLYGADLRSEDLTGADLGSANLSRADLSSANLSGALMPGVYLSGANLTGANLSGANLRSARMYKANLSHANLSYANLTYWADLSWANLSWANLSGADLSPGSQYLSGANLTMADLTGADLSGAIMPDYRVCNDNSIGECK
jgi:Pentapeptide repeats (8 copies)/Carboxypeptidase regulatory-like domain